MGCSNTRNASNIELWNVEYFSHSLTFLSVGNFRGFVLPQEPGFPVREVALAHDDWFGRQLEHARLGRSSALLPAWPAGSGGNLALSPLGAPATKPHSTYCQCIYYLVVSVLYLF